jgi:hypothetical protein
MRRPRPVLQHAEDGHAHANWWSVVFGDAYADNVADLGAAADPAR